MAVKSRPSAVSRVSVRVVLFDRMSTSPDCSAVKRCWAVSGTYFTFSESPKIAAETARQTSTSRPTHLPWLSATANPAVPVGTPQTSAPRDLIESRSLPARAVPETSIAANAAVVVSVNLRIYQSPIVALLDWAQVSPHPPPQATGQIGRSPASVVAGERILGPSLAARARALAVARGVHVLLPLAEGNQRLAGERVVAAVGRNIGLRVDELAVDDHREMQMRSGRAAGRS